MKKVIPILFTISLLNIGVQSVFAQDNKKSILIKDDKETNYSAIGVEPIDEWTCPDTHPIKGNINIKKGTKIYHLPSGAYYSKTKPEKCYATEKDAIADGFRKSKR